MGGLWGLGVGGQPVFLTAAQALLNSTDASRLTPGSLGRVFVFGAETDLLTNTETP